MGRMLKLRKMHLMMIGLFFIQGLGAQNFTKEDTLRGSITPERKWWDVFYYDLTVAVKPDERSIKGFNTIHYRVLREAQIMQIDLQAPLKIDSIFQNGFHLTHTSIGSAHFIELIEMQEIGALEKLTVHYSGQPREAKQPPWDGGFVWAKDKNNRPYISTACQGIGASVWWPCKDHMCDEVDSMRIVLDTPSGLMGVSNGRLIQWDQSVDGASTCTWKVVNPINNYGVNLNMADYAHFNEQYTGKQGSLDCDYYVLPSHLEAAKKQFMQVPKMLEAFEYWFGPYPFYADGYKLVEVPYLGMEHQSSVTYGNGYKNGYMGRDLSETGWGLKFDFIIIHESAHEWFANSITYKDAADMWIHEAFATYAEALYLEYHFGKNAGDEYVIGLRNNISNSAPIIGFYGVNHHGSTDMYYKGANMLHTLRQLVEDDSLWHELLLGINDVFYHQTVSSRQIESYISLKLEKDLSAFFDQYLRQKNIPVFEYKVDGRTLYYRWNDSVEGFDMPVRVKINEDVQWMFPTEAWNTLKLQTKDPFIEVDVGFYVDQRRIRQTD